MAGQLAEQLGLTVRTVMVDAGHGGMDSGARGAFSEMKYPDRPRAIR